MNTYDKEEKDDSDAFYKRRLRYIYNRRFRSAHGGVKRTSPSEADLVREHFAPTLSALTGDEMFPHVAKHARRSVNPPADSWVAFANSKRGYKKLPHFQIGLWDTHMFVWFAIIYESPIKEEYGRLLEAKQEDITKQIPGHFVWSPDHTKPGAYKQSDMDQEQLKTLFERLQTVKSRAFVRHSAAKEDVINMNNNEFLQTIEDAFRKLSFYTH